MSEKLVRDRIPEIAPDRSYRTATLSEMPALLLAKLREEAAELLATEPGSPEEIEEAADVWEVACTLVGEQAEVAAATSAKRRKRGGFQGRVVLLSE